MVTVDESITLNAMNNIQHYCGGIRKLLLKISSKIFLLKLKRDLTRELNYGNNI